MQSITCSIFISDAFFLILELLKFSAILGFLSCVYHYVHQIYLSIYRSIYQSITYTPVNNPEDKNIYS